MADSLRVQHGDEGLQPASAWHVYVIDINQTGRGNSLPITKRGTMAKFDHLKEVKKKDSEPTYDEREDLHGVISRENFELVRTVNKMTIGHLGKEWTNNVKKNRKYWRRHQKIRDLTGLGRNKAVIGIGAGPSFHKNKDVLKHYVTNDGIKSWPDREFITIASNHQFKPLLEMGIIPDFVLLVDASDVVLDQLTNDIPKEAQHTQLITGVHAHPNVIKRWDNQGRGIVFYSTPAEVIQVASKEYLKRGYKEHVIEMGGNVLNGAFMIGIAALQSTIFMGVGNDLSFPESDDIEKQRKGYYADGDYSTNAEVTGTGRDEGKSPKRWAGYRMEKRKVISLTDPIGCHARYNFELDVVGTSHTLWVYKIWLETTMMGQASLPVLFHYFNCTEGGILGVMARDSNDEALRDPKNWFFLDEACINKHTGKQMYMTAMLEDAIEIYLRSRRSQKWDFDQDARYATGTEVVN